MNKRFIQIKNSNGTIPVGASTQNITLPDGTILNDVLGDLNAPIRGSIAERLNNIVSNTGKSISNKSPHFKQGLYVDKYLDENNTTTEVFQVLPSETGQSETIVTDKLRVNGSLIIEKDNINNAGTTPIITLDNNGILTGNVIVDGSLTYEGAMKVNASTGLRVQNDNNSEFRIIPPLANKNSTTFINDLVNSSFQFQIGESSIPVQINSNGITTNKISLRTGLERNTDSTTLSNSIPFSFYTRVRSDLTTVMDNYSNQSQPLLLRVGHAILEGFTGETYSLAQGFGVARIFTDSNSEKKIQYFYVSTWSNKLYYTVATTFTHTPNNGAPIRKIQVNHTDVFTGTSVSGLDSF